MPLFDFICRKCRKEFETLVMGGEKPECPDCGSDDLKKMVSAFSTRSASDGSGGGISAGKCSGCSGGNCSTC